MNNQTGTPDGFTDMFHGNYIQHNPAIPDNFKLWQSGKNDLLRAPDILGVSDIGFRRSVRPSASCGHLEMV